MDKDNFPDLGNSASHSRANTRQESRPLAPDPPSGCTASAATLGVRGSIGSVLVSISTGELLRKESFVLLEKRKCRGEQWETALRIIIHTKPLNTGFKSTVETQLVTDSEKHKCECGWQSGVADEPGWEIFCWVSRAATRGLLGGSRESQDAPSPSGSHNHQAPKVGTAVHTLCTINCIYSSTFTKILSPPGSLPRGPGPDDV